MDKKSLRFKIKERLISISGQQRAVRSEKICLKLLEHNDITRARVIAVYMELNDEVSLECLRQMLSEKTICIPKVEGDNMEFYRFEGHTSKGSFGIEEPLLRDRVSADEIDVMIVPGRAFSTGGLRLGRGRGYYDKYMSRSSFRALTFGVCFQEQLSEEIPLDPHDRKVDYVIYG